MALEGLGVDVVGLGLVAAVLGVAPELPECLVLGLRALGQLGELVEVLAIADRGFQLADPGGLGVGSRNLGQEVIALGR